MLELFDLEPKDRLVAQLLRSQGLISAEQLKCALERARASLFFSLSEVLVGEGVVTLDRLEAVLADYCRKLRLGELAVAKGVISEEHLEIALSFQEGKESRIGEIFVEMHYATPEQIAMLVDFQSRCRTSAVPGLSLDAAV
ncbi:MAG: hypothetical protein VKP62_08765 [Candidatus Sericytochromatia bacterium]|nr:hypothetical protein [Candidatus Sericytochromatia bacterium]